MDLLIDPYFQGEEWGRSGRKRGDSILYKGVQLYQQQALGGDRLSLTLVAKIELPGAIGPRCPSLAMPLLPAGPYQLGQTILSEMDQWTGSMEGRFMWHPESFLPDWVGDLQSSGF